MRGRRTSAQTTITLARGRRARGAQGRGASLRGRRAAAARARGAHWLKLSRRRLIVPARAPPNQEGVAPVKGRGDEAAHDRRGQRGADALAQGRPQVGEHVLQADSQGRHCQAEGDLGHSAGPKASLGGKHSAGVGGLRGVRRPGAALRRLGASASISPPPCQIPGKAPRVGRGNLTGPCSPGGRRPHQARAWAAPAAESATFSSAHPRRMAAALAVQRVREAESAWSK